MSGSECHRHPSLLSDDLCGDCGRMFCEPCLLYLDGERALPRCQPCALVAAGVRPRSSVRPTLSRRELRRLRRQRRREGRPPRRSGDGFSGLPPLVEASGRTSAEHDPFAWADGLDRFAPARSGFTETLPSRSASL